MRREGSKEGVQRGEWCGNFVMGKTRIGCVLLGGTSLRRKTYPPRITIGPWASGHCKVLRGGGDL